MQRGRWGEKQRGVSPVIGVTLLVAITVLMAAVVAVSFVSTGDKLAAPSANANFDYNQHPAGLEMTLETTSTEVSIQLNGQELAVVGPDSVGRSVLLPTAPGDRLTVVSSDEQQTVLVDETLEDRNKLGDFISYYTFQTGSDYRRLRDDSGFGNHGSLTGNPTWRGGKMEFDNEYQHIDVDDISHPSDVEEFTIAAVFNQTSQTDGDIHQVIEHNESSTEWLLETEGTGSGEYRVRYEVDHDERVNSSNGLKINERQVAVGTYNGSVYELYLNGTRVGYERNDTDVAMGKMVIGSDAPTGTSQGFFGEMEEIRLYHHAFNEREVARITEAMAYQEDEG